MAHAIEIVESKLYSGAVADEIVASVAEAIADHGSCSLVLAGGGTPASIYRALSKPPRVNEVDWQKVRIYLGDERWVPRDDNQSNAKMVSETLVSQIPDPGTSFFAVDTSCSSPDDGAKAYQATILQQEGKSSVDDLKFDVVLLGVGEDGHTASLFPDCPVLQPRWQEQYAATTLCAAVEHPSGGYRITLTPRVLFSARKVYFIVSGVNKASILQRVMEGNEPITVLPARLFTTATGRVTWFLDNEAAQQLKNKP